MVNRCVTFPRVTSHLVTQTNSAWPSLHAVSTKKNREIDCLWFSLAERHRALCL